jgi:hypothetical protein
MQTSRFAFAGAVLGITSVALAGGATLAQVVPLAPTFFASLSLMACIGAMGYLRRRKS